MHLTVLGLFFLLLQLASHKHLQSVMGEDTFIQIHMPLKLLMESTLLMMIERCGLKQRLRTSIKWLEQRTGRA
jgi:hypothetical protein